MALFEFEDGHLVPAQFGRPVANGLSPEVLEAVRGQVLEIVSRPLFPITWRDMSRVSDPSNEQPRLTALDASGQVVSVEVLDHLDSDTLIASLSRLADTAALSWTDLAREYPGDVEGFKEGWVHFRDSMPPSPAPGPRLVMVVGSIDLQVRPALDVLASSGVEVHEMSLRQMSNGRAFLEVHAVGPRLYGHSPQVLLGRTGSIPELGSTPTGAAALPAPGRHGAGLPDVGAPVEETDSTPGGPSGPRGSEEHVVAPGSGTGAGEDDSAVPEWESLPSTTGTAPGVGDGTHPVTGPTPIVPPGDRETSVAPARHAAREVPEEETPDLSRPSTTIPHLPAHEGTWSEAVGAWEDAATQEAPGHGAHGVPTEVGDEESVAQAAQASEAASWSSADHPHADGPAPLPEGVPVLLRDAQAMEALGRIVGEEAPLVLRPSLDPTAEGVLTPQGQVRVPAGEFDDPTEALAASGHPGLDGWDEWHLGDHRGPSLAESLDEVNAEIIREYERAGERQGRH